MAGTYPFHSRSTGFQRVAAVARASSPCLHGQDAHATKLPAQWADMRRRIRPVRGHIPLRRVGCSLGGLTFRPAGMRAIDTFVKPNPISVHKFRDFRVNPEYS